MSVAKDSLFYNLGKISSTGEEKDTEVLCFRLSEANTTNKTLPSTSKIKEYFQEVNIKGTIPELLTQIHNFS